MARKTEKAKASKSKAPTATTDARKNSSMEVVPLKKGVKTFFDLPGEIRNQIYAELLPNVPDPRQTYTYPNLRTDGSKTSTAFMASCKPVYEESSSVLYHFLDIGEGELSVRIERDGSVFFLGKDFKLATATSANFAAIKRAKKLEVSVSTSESSNTLSICDAQDALFIALSGNLETGHLLQSLDIRISTEHPNDFGLGMFSSNFAGRMQSQSVMREFGRVVPGDVSRAHVAAFLTDSLRTIRDIKDGKKTGKFKLDFAGKSGRPWREIEGQVRKLIQSDATAQVPDYKVFCDYFATLRQLRAVTREGRVIWIPQRELWQLGRARIQGDVEGLHKRHHSMLESLKTVEKVVLNHANADSSEHAELREQKCREMFYLYQELEEKLPKKDADTSFFGYKIADDGLREWQKHGRQAEKEAKAKRKQEKEAAGESRKKMRVRY